MVLEIDITPPYLWLLLHKNEPHPIMHSLRLFLTSWAFVTKELKLKHNTPQVKNQAAAKIEVRILAKQQKQ
jgi:hypothetical protein